MLIPLLTSLLAFQSLAERAWTWNLDEARTDAVKRKKPWVLLINVDAPSAACQMREGPEGQFPPPAVKNIEPLLRNCEALIRLRAMYPVAALRKADVAAAGGLPPAEPKGHLWAAVYAPDGGLLGAMAPEMTEDRGTVMPAEGFKRMTDWIAEAVRRPLTIEDLENEFLKGTEDDGVPADLLYRFREMGARDRIKATAAKVAGDESKTPRARALGDLYAFLGSTGRAAMMSFTRDSRVEPLGHAKRAILAIPRHPRMGEVAKDLVAVVLSYAFDVPSKTADFVEEVTKELASAPDPAASRQILGRIKSELTAWEKEIRASRRFGDWEKARMGDAAATLKAFDRPEYAGYAQYREWVEDARKKLGR